MPEKPELYDTGMPPQLGEVLTPHILDALVGALDAVDKAPTVVGLPSLDEMAKPFPPPGSIVPPGVMNQLGSLGPWGVALMGLMEIGPKAKKVLSSLDYGLKGFPKPRGTKVAEVGKQATKAPITPKAEQLIADTEIEEVIKATGVNPETFRSLLPPKLAGMVTDDPTKIKAIRTLLIQKAVEAHKQGHPEFGKLTPSVEAFGKLAPTAEVKDVPKKPLRHMLLQDEIEDIKWLSKHTTLGTIIEQNPDIDPSVIQRIYEESHG